MVKKFVTTYKTQIKKDFQSVKDVVFLHDGCPNYNKNVERIELLGEGKNGGLGTSRKCILYAGGSVIEEVDVETEDTCGVFITDESANKPMPLNYIGPSFTVKKIDDDTTELISQVIYLPKLMPVTYPMGAFILKKPLGELAYWHAAGVKHYCETGEVVTDKTDLGTPQEFTFAYEEK